MFCANCGAQFDGAFCPNCGAPTTNNNQQTNQNNYDSNPQDNGYNPGGYGNVVYDQPQQPKKSNSVLIAVVAVAAVIIIGLVATVIVLGSNKSDSKSEPTAEATTTEVTTTAEVTQATSNFQASDNANNNSGSSVVEPDFTYKSTTCYIGADVGLILRDGPGQSYNKIYTIKYANAVTVLGGTDSASNWVYVDHSGTKGWVCSDYLSSTKPTTAYKSSGTSISSYESVSSWTTSVKPAKGLNIRSGATTSSYSYTVLRQGTTVTVLGVSNYNSNWYYVSAYQGGRTYYGFVSSDYLY